MPVHNDFWPSPRANGMLFPQDPRCRLQDACLLVWLQKDEQMIQFLISQPKGRLFEEMSSELKLNSSSRSEVGYNTVVNTKTILP